MWYYNYGSIHFNPYPAGVCHRSVDHKSVGLFPFTVKYDAFFLVTGLT